MIILEIIGAIAVLAWTRAAFICFRRRHLLTSVDHLTTPSAHDALPAVTVIVPVRNEAAQIGSALRTLLLQDYRPLRVLAFDDGSTDGTGKILQGLSEEFSNLEVKRIDHLPAGWLGKNHAMHLGFQATESEWILFSDADVYWQPDTLRRAVGYALATPCDYLTIMCGPVCIGFFERLCALTYHLYVALNLPVWRITDPRQRANLGLGQFILLRRSILERFQGMERLRLSILDDFDLGQIAKCAGYRCGFLHGGSALMYRCQVGVRGYILGFEKNFFAIFNYDLRLVIIALISVNTLFMGIHLGAAAAVTGGDFWLLLLYALGFFAIASIVTFFAAQVKARWFHIVALPAAACLWSTAVLWSVGRALSRGKIGWRERLYPLPSLIVHNAEKQRWLARLFAASLKESREL